MRRKHLLLTGLAVALGCGSPGSGNGGGPSTDGGDGDDSIRPGDATAGAEGGGMADAAGHPDATATEAGGQDAAPDGHASPSADAGLPVIGVNTHQARGNTTPTPDATNVMLAQAAGARMVRFGADWQTLEGTPGTYDFSSLDPTVQAFRAAGIGVMLAICYGNTSYTGAYFNAPIGATNVGHYADFAAEVAKHYGADGFVYEIWNEPNLGWDWMPSPNATDYAALLTASAAAIKAAEPGAVVISGGVSPGSGIDPDTFITGVVASATLTNVDGFGLHPYNTTYPEQAIADTSAFAAASMSARPVYDTEWGYSQDWVGDDQMRRAIFAARTILSAIVSPAKTHLWYDLIDDGQDAGDHESNFGLYTFDFTQLPAATAYAAINTALQGATSYSVALTTSMSLYVLTLEKPSSLTRVVWTYDTSITGTTYSETETSVSAATASDVFGSPVPVTVSGTDVSFSLSEAAGPVILDVQP